MNRDYFPSAVGSLVCSILGIVCFVLLSICRMEWMNILMIASFILFGLAVLMGGYSLFIKKSKPARIGLIISVAFLAMFLVLALLLRNMCVIC